MILFFGIMGQGPAPRLSSAPVWRRTACASGAFSAGRSLNAWAAKSTAASGLARPTPLDRATRKWRRKRLKRLKTDSETAPPARRCRAWRIDRPNSHQLGDLEEEPAKGREPRGPEKHDGGHGVPPGLMKHPGEQRRAPSRFTCDRERDFAPIPREKVAACLFSAPASFGVGLAAKVGNQRFRFEGDGEPQIVWPLVIGHLKNSWPPNPFAVPVKHNA
jgi:hypothetical protein